MERMESRERKRERERERERERKIERKEGLAKGSTQLLRWTSRVNTRWVMYLER